MKMKKYYIQNNILNNIYKDIELFILKILIVFIYFFKIFFFTFHTMYILQ
jgi:hypothetical protein